MGTAPRTEAKVVSGENGVRPHLLSSVIQRKAVWQE